MKKPAMQKKEIVWIISVALLCCIVALIYVNRAAVSMFLFGSRENTRKELPRESSSIVLGAKAINPNIDPAPATGPTFTLDDAKAYIVSHPISIGITTDGQPATLENIYFTTDVEVKKLTGYSSGVTSDTLVLVVIEKGPFILNKSMVPPGEKPPTINRVVRVFNARTGNYLAWTVLN